MVVGFTDINCYLEFSVIFLRGLLVVYWRRGLAVSSAVTANGDVSLCNACRI